MKKSIAVSLLVLLLTLIGFFTYQYYNKSPKLSDNAKSAWLKRCSSSECVEGVEKYYLKCATSISYVKPENNENMAEFIMLSGIEIEDCLSEKIGSSFEEH